MREFFYKSSFIRYFSSLAYGRMSFKSSGVITMSICVIVMLLNFMLNLATGLNPFLALLTALVVVLFIVCFSFGVRLRNIPNLASIIPMSHRKKTAWFMLSPVFATVLGCIVFILFVLLFYGLDSAFTAACGLPVEPFVDDEDLYYICQLGGFGGGFIAIYLLICYSIGIIAGLIKRNLYRNLTLAAFLVVNTLFMLIVNCVSTTVNGKSVRGASPFMAQSYVNFPNLWVVILIFGIVALGLFGYAVYLCYDRYRTDKY